MLEKSGMPSNMPNQAVERGGMAFMYMLNLVFVFHHIRLFFLVTLDRTIDIPGT